jgi:hypothetical protein
MPARPFAVAALATALLAFGNVGAAHRIAGGPVAPPPGWVPGQRTASCMVVEVRTPNGRPVPGAVIQQYDSDPYDASSNHIPVSGPEWTADAGGRVCAEELLEPGYLEVDGPELAGGWCAGFEVVHHPGWSAASGKPPAVAITLHLRRVRWSRVVGRVVDVAGHPIAGARVNAVTVSPKRTGCSTEGSGSVTDEDGTFQFSSPEGGAALTITASGFAGRKIEVDAPAPRRAIPLYRGAEWTGRVIDPEGAPIEACIIKVRRRDGVEVDASCSPTGFALHHLPPGVAKLSVRLRDTHLTLGPERVLLATVYVGDEERRHQDIVWPAGACIWGTVVTADGMPVPGAEVLAISTDADRANAGDDAKETADGTGRFTFQHLGPGDWRLVGDRRNVSEQGSVVVAAGTSGARLVVPRPKR